MKRDGSSSNSGIEPGRAFVQLQIGSRVTVNRVPGLVVGFSPMTWGEVILISVNGSVGEYHPVDVNNGTIELVATEETAR